ncbi:MAG: asparagine synthase (glutamine-hydrolyzing), partial [Anaerolineales bacterium]
MCGIVGILNLTQEAPINEHAIRQMLAMVRHRGPDEFGIYLEDQVGLGSARLSIIDLSGGQQPISNEDETLWIVFNGEIFNYVELRPELERKGHQFRTNSDTETILHLYEDHGPACLKYLNGQFAIAIWDTRNNSLFLARDRLGIRPLFYATANDKLIFGSEIKAILAEGTQQANIDPLGIDQVFTYWSTQTPHTSFVGIKEIPPGHFLLAQQNDFRIEQYWRINFPSLDETPSWANHDEFIDEFRELLIDSTKIRLRADVPVGAYLSGGLDSSVTSTIIRNYTGNQLDTFSISFSDAQFDESVYQIQMAKFLGTEHQVVRVSYDDIRDIFPKVIWHSE